ncbi:MAG: DNA repair protein RadA, partial [Desulfobulbaceae bacterium]|nr:DNA repair protein RadA [Desulfobulbaceae bacterium]
MKPSAKKNDIWFVCANCSHKSRKWLGRCPSCQEWDSLSEQKMFSKSRSGKQVAQINTLSSTISEEAERIVTGMGELDRVLGGGIV